MTSFDRVSFLAMRLPNSISCRPLLDMNPMSAEGWGVGIAATRVCMVREEEHKSRASRVKKGEKVQAELRHILLASGND